VDIKRVPETVPADVAKASYFKIDQKAPVATIDELANYDAIIIGALPASGVWSPRWPTSWIRQAAWMKGALNGKVGGGLYVNGNPTRWPGDDALLDHYQPAAFRHDRRRSALQLPGPDDAR